MIKINREVYERDPSLNRLLNQGVAKVTSGDRRTRARHASLRDHELRLRWPVRQGPRAHPSQLPDQPR